MKNIQIKTNKVFTGLFREGGVVIINYLHSARDNYFTSTSVNLDLFLHNWQQMAI